MKSDQHFYSGLKGVALVIIVIWAGLGLAKMGSLVWHQLQSNVIPNSVPLYLSGPTQVEQGAEASYDFAVNAGSPASEVPLQITGGGNFAKFHILAGDCVTSYLGETLPASTTAFAFRLSKGGNGRCAGTVSLQFAQDFTKSADQTFTLSLTRTDTGAQSSPLTVKVKAYYLLESTGGISSGGGNRNDSVDLRLDSSMLVTLDQVQLNYSCLQTSTPYGQNIGMSPSPTSTQSGRQLTKVILSKGGTTTARIYCGYQYSYYGDFSRQYYANFGQEANVTLSFLPRSCGNGAVELQEQCDDGNNLSGDGCSASCQLEPRSYCGNGKLESPDEQCDGSLGVGPHQTCSAQCTLKNLNYCGDGKKQSTNDEGGSEACDGKDGVGDHQVCSSTCALVNLDFCGDQKRQSGEECDGTDGVGFHQSCSAQCTLVNLPYCGNGKKENAETCDGKDGLGDHQKCSSNCTLEALPYCGDGKKNGSEACDGSDGVGDHQKCNADCSLEKLPFCGDGIPNASEECDNGPANNGKDGKCDAQCKKVPAPVTGAQPLPVPAAETITALPVDLKISCLTVSDITKLSACTLQVPGDTIEAKLEFTISKKNIDGIQNVKRAASLTSGSSTFRKDPSASSQTDTFLLSIDYVDLSDKSPSGAPFALLQFDALVKVPETLSFPFSIDALVGQGMIRNSQATKNFSSKQALFFTLPDLKKTVINSSFKVDVPPPPPAPLAHGAAGSPYCFQDADNSMTPDEWKIICEAKKKNFISGTQRADGIYFNPDTPVNRAEAAKILTEGVLLSLGKMSASQFASMTAELQKRYPKEKTILFDDIAFERGGVLPWFAADVGLASRDGIVAGYPDGTFQPSNKITNLEAVKMIVETASLASAKIKKVLLEQIKVTIYREWYQKYLGTLQAFEVDTPENFTDVMSRKDFVIMLMGLLKGGGI